MSAKSIAGWSALAFLIWWVIADGPSAAHVAHHISNWLSSTASDITNLFASI